VKLDNPPVVAEIAAMLDRYDRAIAGNDLDALDKMFWRSDKTLRYGPQGTSRQSQTWVRMPEGWRIVSAHVSDFAAAS